MDVFLPSHLKLLMVIVYCYLPTGDVCVKILKTIEDRETFSFDVDISGFRISQVFTCEGNGVAILYE